MIELSTGMKTSPLAVTLKDWLQRPFSHRTGPFSFCADAVKPTETLQCIVIPCDIITTKRFSLLIAFAANARETGPSRALVFLLLVFCKNDAMSVMRSRQKKEPQKPHAAETLRPIMSNFS